MVLKTVCAYFLCLVEEISREVVVCRFYFLRVGPKNRINFDYKSVRALLVETAMECSC